MCINSHPLHYLLFLQIESMLVCYLSKITSKQQQQQLQSNRTNPLTNRSINQSFIIIYFIQYFIPKYNNYIIIYGEHQSSSFKHYNPPRNWNQFFELLWFRWIYNIDTNLRTYGTHKIHTPNNNGSSNQIKQRWPTLIVVSMVRRFPMILIWFFIHSVGYVCSISPLL